MWSTDYSNKPFPYSKTDWYTQGKEADIFLLSLRDELKQMDQKTRKQMTMRKTLHPIDDVTRVYVSRKREEADLPSLKTALTHRYNDSKTT